MLARCQPSLMIPTGCWAGLPGNDFAFACKQRADPLGLSEGREGEHSFGVLGNVCWCVRHLNDIFIFECLLF